jgi:hypothetical protein
VNRGLSGRHPDKCNATNLSELSHQFSTALFAEFDTGLVEIMALSETRLLSTIPIPRDRKRHGGKGNDNQPE